MYVVRSRGVMVSTLDFESKDPSSSLGGTSSFFFLPRKFYTYLPLTFFFSLSLCPYFAGAERETF